MQLGLGSVQFGLDYGIANPAGKTAPTEVAAILALAAENGITVLDTAAAYGNSETVLGRAMPPGPNFRIVSKTRNFGPSAVGQDAAAALRADFNKSLERLGVERLYGLLLHHCDDLFLPGGERLLAAMVALKEGGLVEKIGVSVYQRRQIEEVMAGSPIDLLQIPVNVLDQRLTADDLLASISAAGVEIHARSAFLQGLLLMPPEKVADYFAPIRPLLHNYRTAITASGMTAVQAALAFVRRNQAVDHVLVGVTSRPELMEILTAFEGPTFADFDFSPFAVDDARMVDPSQWQVAP